MKTEWKVLVSLIVLLLCMEVGVRSFETELSKDLAHLRGLPAAAELLKEGDTYKILIVGNSLARYAIDQEMLADGLENKGYGKVQVEAFHPDGTGITEWNYGLRRYFLNIGAIPDRIVVVTGEAHLLDKVSVPERLGAFYVDRQQVKEAIFTDLASVENTARFFLARLSSLIANRTRIQPFVFYNYLPAYTQTIQVINDQRKTLDGEGGVDEKRMTNLSRLLQAGQSNEVTVSIVAVPMPEAYELPQAVTEEIVKCEAVLWDLSETGEIDNKNFFDGYHLDVDGAGKVTQALIDRIPSKK